MNNFLEKFIEADPYTRKNLTSNWLHGIKSFSEESCFKYFKDLDFEYFNTLNEEDKVLFIKLVVLIENAFEERFGRFPKWCLDERLVLKNPYLGKGYDVSWLFFGVQAFYRHNCFLDPRSLTVY